MKLDDIARMAISEVSAELEKIEALQNKKQEELERENLKKELLAIESANEQVLEEPKVEAKAEPKEEKKEEGIISIDDFAKIVIKVGEVLECERVEGSEKLLKFKIDLGEEQPRQILSGIAKYYEPSSLVGKQVCVLANLKERTMMKKYVSQGMILSASDGSLTLLGTQGKVKNGAIVG